jgi:hypothetical protein
MEATAWEQFDATERSPSMYIRMRVLPWSNTLLAWQVDHFSPLVNQPVVTTAVNVEYGRRKIATAWAQFGATERSPSMYIMRVLPGVTLC